MKKIVITLLCLGAMASLNCIAKPAKVIKSNEQSLDKIVAIVNEDVITHSELDQTISIMKIQLGQGQSPKQSELETQAMEQLINKKLQLQIAKQAGVEASDEDLDKAIEQVAESNNVSVSELMEHVHQGGMSTTDYRNEVRDQITLQKLQQQEFAGKIPPISPKEIANLMRSKSWQNMNSPEREYHLEDVIIPVSDSPSVQEIADAKARAESVLDKLQQGQDINTIKKADAKPIEGGDLGWRKMEEIPTAFTEHVEKMQEKDVAGPIQTSNGFHLVHLIAARALASKSAPDTKQAEQYLLQRKIDDALKIWISKLRSQAYIVTNPENA